jgi:hypothetical protein
MSVLPYVAARTGDGFCRMVPTTTDKLAMHIATISTRATCFFWATVLIEYSPSAFLLGNPVALGEFERLTGL